MAATKFITALLFLIGSFGHGYALDCYSCASQNGSDRLCDDPMIRMYKEVLTPVTCDIPTTINVNTLNGTADNETGPGYEVDEKSEPEAPFYKEPEHFCVKVIGTTTETKENLVIRSCISKDMNSQCGKFKYKGVPVRGCMLTCKKDLCNAGETLRGTMRLLIMVMVLIGIYYSNS